MKKFIERNEGFICINCGKRVNPHPTSSRDHCPCCLYSLHVDIYPGDRKEKCHGLLVPIGLRIKNGKRQIVYRCNKCEAIRYCIVAPDDNKDILIQLASNVWKE